MADNYQYEMEKVLMFNWRIPKSFKNKWLMALRGRSDHNYLQIENTLAESCGGYCALGVAFHAAGNIPYEDLIGATTLEDANLSSEKMSRIPEAFYISDNYDTLSDKIVEFNDTYNWTFDEIADWIEISVEGWDESE